MRSLSSALRDRLENSVENRAIPVLIAEWNQNRYAGIGKVDSIPAEATAAFDAECFPVASIVEPNRPEQGILKGITAREGTAAYWRVSPPQRHEAYAEKGYQPSTRPVRYYTVDKNTPYKYWVSQAATAATATSAGNYEFPSNQYPTAYMVYKELAWTNKIVVGIEGSWSRPRNFVIEGTQDGQSWFSIVQNPTINSVGQVVIYRQADGSWSNNINRVNPMQLLGLRIRATSMDSPTTNLHLIELSCRLEVDISSDVVTYSSEFSMDEPNFITPLGVSSSNMGDVTLSNVDGRYNNDKADSLYYGIIDANIKFTGSLVFDVGTAKETIRQFTMYTDQWSGGDESEVTVSLKDFSKYMQEQACPNRLMEEVTIGEAVWRICDSIGFTQYRLDSKSDAANTNIPWFWATGEDTVWQTFQDLAQATQTAIYFDEYGTLRIQTRDAAFDKHKPVAWDFEATNHNGKLADVESAEWTRDFEANTVDITYKNTKISDYEQGWPKMEVVWTPEGTFLLRAAPLAADLAPGDMEAFLSKDLAIEWPYEGMFQLQGEIITFKGKEYTYFKKEGGTATVWLYSYEEQQTIDNTKSSEFYKYKNSYTGRMKLVKRGVNGSQIRHHYVRHENYNARHFIDRGNHSNFSWGMNGGITPNYHTSTITIRSNYQFDQHRILTLTHGDPNAAPPANYGCRMKIPLKGYGGKGAAGLVINTGGGGDAGYFIELMPSDFLNDNGGVGRSYHNELMFWRRGYDGSMTAIDNTKMINEQGQFVFGSTGGRGVPIQITRDSWYDLDVEFRYGKPSPMGGYEHTFMIYVNGNATMAVTLPTNRLTPTGQYGMFIRGDMACEFEYLYAHQRAIEIVPDDMSIYDRIKGAYASAYWDRNYAYLPYVSENWQTGAYVQDNGFFFDEFGPIAHEVREMSVAFEKYPVIHSDLFLSNSSQVILPDYNGNPFGADFTLANASRLHAVANGEDQSSFGKENSVEQKMFIKGRLVYQEDEETHTIKDEDAIRARGRVDVEINNKWIQTKAEAESLGNWIIDNWAGGCDEVRLSTYGNPVIQVGDLVSVNYPNRGMYRQSHKYFVVEVSSEFDEGLSTNLILRRAKI